MTTERFNYICDRIKQAKASGETDTKLGRVLARWEDIDIPLGDSDGKWLMEGFILEAKRQREIWSAIDPSISPNLPPHMFDPAMIAHFWGVPLEEFSGFSGPVAATKDAVSRSGLRCLNAHDIMSHFDGKISLRLAYKIMDQCREVHAGKKRLITAESFEEYLRQGEIEAPHESPGPPRDRNPITGSNRGRRSQTDGYEFFPPPSS